MTVPEDLRGRVGKTSWTQSLRTADPLLAKQLRAKLVEKYTALVRELRAECEQAPRLDAVATLGRLFERRAALRGSMDAVVAYELERLGWFVVDSWNEAPEQGLPQSWGDWTAYETIPAQVAVPSIDGAPERDIFRLRAEIIEGRGIADGFVYQDLAAALLQRRVFQPIWFVISYLRSWEPRLPLEPDDVYEVVAEAYLRRLAEHRFESWPSNVHAALGMSGSTSAPPSPAISTGAASKVLPTSPHQGQWARPLTEALRFWRDERRPGPSAVTEATRSVERFVALFGDMAVGDITREKVLEFRDFIIDIPPQTELAKIVASGRPLAAVIEEARKRRQEWEDGDREESEPDRLAPGSVKKDIGALSQIFGAIVENMRAGENVALRVPVPGYSKKRKGQKSPRLPFTPAMMQALFDSPLFTGCAGPGGAARTRRGTHIYQDELYWCFLFGVMGGPRLGEVGQIALSDVHPCDLRRTYGEPYEGHCTFIHITGTGEGQHVKNDNSDRRVVIHRRLIELGFNDYVERRRAAGKTRLFDLEPDKNGNFVKELSRRLNRYLDATVTQDRRYVFHSTRHEFTDRADLSLIPARVSKSIKGHANNNAGDEYGLVSILLQYTHLERLEASFIDWPRLLQAARSAGTLEAPPARRHRKTAAPLMAVVATSAR